MAVPKARFVVDSQTLTQAAWFIIPGGMAYAYAYFNSETEEQRENDLNENYKTTMTKSRKGSAALGPVFEQRRINGKFDPAMEQKLDDLLRAGNKKRVRVNTDNEGFHMKGGAIGLSKGLENRDLILMMEEIPESDDWRAGLTGAEIIKEQKRRRKKHKKKMKKLLRQQQQSASLMEELTNLRGTNDTPEIKTRKKNIKQLLKSLGVNYNSLLRQHDNTNEPSTDTI